MFVRSRTVCAAKFRGLTFGKAAPFRELTPSGRKPSAVSGEGGGVKKLHTDDKSIDRPQLAAYSLITERGARVEDGSRIVGANVKCAIN